MLKHFTMAFLFGFMSLLVHSNSDVGNVDFQTFSIILSWIFILLFITTTKWFDKITNIYFIFTILFAVAARLAKYNSDLNSKEITLTSILFIAGLAIQCFSKNKVSSGMLVFGVLVLDWVNMNLLYEESVDLSGLIPQEFYPLK
uniref:Uncharacterized protein n=1 Tax=viral metagenome TaxID=1070528 RepID=A0A6C0BDZ7_9ZZZZ